MREWEKFKIGEPSNRENWKEDSCLPFSKVAHVSHISSSLTILKEKQFRRGLVSDEKSKLNTKRILITWTSPNYWSHGFPYGNVSFQFDWADLIAEKKYYWVESVPHPKSTACRILITTKEYKNLEEYIPEQPDGPWWYDRAKNQHYYNNKYWLEFMIEDDLRIDQNIEINFVNHHKELCLNPKKCQEIGKHSQEAAGIFLASIASNSMKVPKLLFSNGYECIAGIPNPILDGFSSLRRILADDYSATYSGNINSEDNVAIALARSVCNAYTTSNQDDIIYLRSLFKDKGHFTKALAKLMDIHFGIPNWKKLNN